MIILVMNTIYKMCTLQFNYVHLQFYSGHSINNGMTEIIIADNISFFFIFKESIQKVIGFVGVLK